MVSPEEKLIFERSHLLRSRHIGTLYGTPNNFTLNQTSSLLENYSHYLGLGAFYEDHVYAIPGQIKVPVAGHYQISTFVLGDQGNDEDEAEIELIGRLTDAGARDGDYLLGAAAAIEDTSHRQLGGTFVVLLPRNAKMELRMQATANLGTFSFIRTTFETEFMALA